MLKYRSFIKFWEPPFLQGFAKLISFHLWLLSHRRNYYLRAILPRPPYRKIGRPVNPWSVLYHLQRSSVLVGQRKHERSQFCADYMKCRHHCFLLFIFHLFTNELSYDNVPYLPDIIIIMKSHEILV